MNIRLVVIVIIAAIVIVMSCVGLYLYYDAYIVAPQVSNRQVTRVHETALAVAETEAAVAKTEAYAQTLTAQPTITPTPSQTPSPTSTPTDTPAPPKNICLAKIADTKRLMLAVPGGGVREGSKNLSKGSEVEIIGRVQDLGWYQVQYQGDVGWLRSDFVAFDGSDCKPTIYDLSYLLGVLGDHYRPLLDDTFMGNENNWVDDDGQPVFSEETDYRESQLAVRAANETRIISSNTQKLASLTDFGLITSLSRENSTTKSYVGIQFRKNDEAFYALRMFGVNDGCLIKIIEMPNEKTIFERVMLTGENICGDDFSDYLVMYLNGYDLEFRVNDSEFLNVTLSDPDGNFTSGTIALEVSNANAAFDFLVLTIPR